MFHELNEVYAANIEYGVYVCPRFTFTVNDKGIQVIPRICLSSWPESSPASFRSNSIAALLQVLAERLERQVV